MRDASTLAAVRQVLELDPEMELQTDPAELARLSRDAYDYSPVLAERLAACRAQLVVSPADVAAVERLAAVCVQHGVPLTVRGAGTGNYGQCVPLEGGVVMLSGGLRAIRELDPITGVVTVEPGCPMRELDQQLRCHGRQLRLLPSTWRSASIRRIHRRRLGWHRLDPLGLSARSWPSAGPGGGLHGSSAPALHAVG